MFVDPVVSRIKFEREVADYRKFSDAYQRRGILLVEANFPSAFAVILAIHAKPAPMVPFGVVLDFPDYDVVPPSVQLVNPITRDKLKMQDIPYQFPRLLPSVVTATGSDGQPMQVRTLQAQMLLQAFVPERPFICLQGVKEYHDSPAHTGDSWFLHRGTGPGTLTFLLDVLSRYGAEPISGPQINIQVTMTGYAVSGIPS